MAPPAKSEMFPLEMAFDHEKIVRDAILVAQKIFKS